MNNQMPTLSFDLGSLDDKAQQGSENNIVKERIKGVQSYAILPPYGKDNGGSLFHKYVIHWGLVGENGKPKPVSCSYPEEKHCPICKRVFEAEDKIKRLKDTGGSKEEIESLTKFVIDFKRKNQFLYNAVTVDGRVVILELGVTAHDELRKKIAETVNTKGIDPCNIAAPVWYQFSRDGKGLDTTYKVDYKRLSVMVDGESLEKIDRTPIAPELQARIKAQLEGKAGPMYDIHSLYEKRTAEELQGYLNGKPVPQKKKEAAPAAAAEAPKTEAKADDIPHFSSPNVSAEMEKLRQLEAQQKG